jgi:hypothetical protein
MRGGAKAALGRIADRLLAGDIAGPDGLPLPEGQYGGLLFDPSLGHPPLCLTYDIVKDRVQAIPFEKEQPGKVPVPFDFDFEPETGDRTGEIAAKLAELSWLLRADTFPSFASRLGAAMAARERGRGR